MQKNGVVIQMKKLLQLHLINNLYNTIKNKII
jgi:hypothetical protein